MTCQERSIQAEGRILEIAEKLRRNSNASEIVTLLAAHYRFLARECMEGFTPRPDLRDYWWKFNMGYQALQRKFKKIEESQ